MILILCFPNDDKRQGSEQGKSLLTWLLRQVYCTPISITVRRSSSKLLTLNNCVGVVAAIVFYSLNLSCSPAQPGSFFHLILHVCNDPSLPFSHLNPFSPASFISSPSSLPPLASSYPYTSPTIPHTEATHLPLMCSDRV